MNHLSQLPAVEHLLQTRQAAELIAAYGRSLTLRAIRQTLDEQRSQLRLVAEATVPSREQILTQVADLLERWTAPTLLPVINATGVILHTNLGRAPLSQAALTAMEAASRGYATLEFDLASGKRGARHVHAEETLKLLTGAEAALVVNNNAAAVLLVLSALARRKRVLVSRTQLIEIGGGFRIPDVLQQSGAKLVEIGTTNKVHLSDYEQALAEQPALVLHAHHSNFKIIGFTEEPSLSEIAALAHRFEQICVDDLGSGALLDTAAYGLAHEPTVQESLAAGADLVCFSGDKLLGGPQAGIIVGRADLVARLKKHPLARALRLDKTRLAALNATLLHYLKDEAEREIPVWQMIAAPLPQLKARALAWQRELGRGEVQQAESTVGGGSLPGETLPTWVLALPVRHVNRFQQTLRRQAPPIIARAEDDYLLFDPRTVLPSQDSALLVGIQNALKLTGECFVAKRKFTS